MTNLEKARDEIKKAARKRQRQMDSAAKQHEARLLQIQRDYERTLKKIVTRYPVEELDNPAYGASLPPLEPEQGGPANA